MCNGLAECVKKYVEQEYKGGLIGISDLAEYCKVTEGTIYVALVELQKQREIKIVKRYFCPEAHQIFFEALPFCSVCNYSYSEDFITTLIYIQPILANQKFN